MRYRKRKKSFLVRLFEKIKNAFAESDKKGDNGLKNEEIEFFDMMEE